MRQSFRVAAEALGTAKFDVDEWVWALGSHTALKLQRLPCMRRVANDLLCTRAMLLGMTALGWRVCNRHL